MNEKIKELLDRVGGYGTQALMHPADVEKFAELIIRECMSEIQRVRQIDVGNAGPIYNQAYDDGMYVAISTIEEHFGIQEEQ